LYEGPENTLWVGSSRGITWLDNRQKPQRRPPPPFEISYSNLQAGKRYPIGRNFRVEVKGLCYYAPRSLRYQYRLDNGLWLPMESPFLDLKGLNRGSHTLRLRARTLESYWSATEVIPFEILAWWQQAFWWGLLVGGLVLSLLIGLLVRRRIRRFKRLNDRLEEEIQNRKQTESRLEKVRTQVAKDFHDEVGNKLASITVLANLAKLHLKSDPPELSPLLNRIEDQSKSLHAATRDFIWSIDSQSDYLKELFFYLRDFGSEFFEGLEVSFYVEGNGVENSELKLLPSWSRHIHLIFKEAMTNVVRHTNSQQVWLRFRLSEKRLWICLENDKGEGPIEPHPQGKGLRSMRERAALLDADLSITPRRVELRLPIPQDGGTIPPK
jgi:signal transduction histidine kinase